MVTKVRERLAVSKQSAQNFDVERFNFRTLSELEVRKQYQIKVSKQVCSFGKFNDSKNINWAWENIKENNKSSNNENLGLSELNVEVLAYFN